jgi:hypothetical protein
MRVLSRLKTKIAYDANKPKGPKVIIAPGVNLLSDEAAEILANDPHWPQHVANGHMVELPPNAPAGTPVVEPVAEVTEDTTPIKPPVSDLSDEDAALIAAYEGLDPSAVAGFVSMLTPEQKAVIEAHDAAKGA